MGKLIMVVMMAVLVVSPVALAAPQVELTTSDANLNSGANLGGITPTVGGAGIVAEAGSRGSPWLYTFTPGGGGLDVNQYKVYTHADAYNYGNTDGGTSFTLNLGGEDVYGNSGSLSLSTLENTTGWPGFGSGHIKVYNVGTVDVGAIDTHNKAHYENAGDVHIGEPVGTGDGPATGNVRVDSIDASDTQSVGGYVKIYGAGNVLIQSNPAGDIDAHGPSRRNMGNPYYQVIVVHNGDFVAQDILTNLKAVANAGEQMFGNYANLGGVQLDGGGGGSATIRDIDTSLDIRDLDGNIHPRTPYWESSGYIDITNYKNVTVRNVDAHQATYSNDKTADGGNLTITGITDNITIQGTIDLSVAGLAANQDPGILTLECDGTITLEQGLDLSKVLYASFDSGPATTEILRAILGSDGDPADGTNIGNLRTPSGDVIYYDPLANPALLRDTYTLADLGGTLLAGGTLEPASAPIPEPAALGLLGLAALLRRRRR